MTQHTPEDRAESAERIEPRIWSHITDVLPDDHPLAWSTVYCVTCERDGMVHAANNECMTTWVETGKGAYCLPHFVDAVRNDQGSDNVFYVLEDHWGLRRSGGASA